MYFFVDIQLKQQNFSDSSKNNHESIFCVPPLNRRQSLILVRLF